MGARADSVIRVSIIGDATKLAAAVGAANRSTGGLLASSTRALGGALLALGAVNAGFDFVKGATKEADRLGDATARLTRQIGPEFTHRLEDTADNFATIGASTQDMLELEAIFADWGTAAGVADPMIASLAESVAATAQALTLTDDQGRDASAMLDLLDKAAGGSAKAAKELGVTLTSGLTPSQQMTDILAQLKGKLDDASSASKDLEGKQSELGAKWETLQGQIGGPLSDALSAVVGFIIDEIDAIPGAIAGWEMLGAKIEGFGRTVLGPLGNVRDALEGILNLLGLVNKQSVNPTVGAGRGSDDQAVTDAARRYNLRNGLGS